MALRRDLMSALPRVSAFSENACDPQYHPRRKWLKRPSIVSGTGTMPADSNSSLARSSSRSTKSLRPDVVSLRPNAAKPAATHDQERKRGQATIIDTLFWVFLYLF